MTSIDNDIWNWAPKVYFTPYLMLKKRDIRGWGGVFLRARIYDKKPPLLGGY